MKFYNQKYFKSIFIELTNNKGIECNLHHKFSLWFTINLAIRTKGDHKGFCFEFRIFGIGIELDFYDFRHEKEI